MKNIKDIEIINLAKKGNQAAFTQLYKKYKPTVKYTVYKKLSNTNLEQSIDDIVQETFIKAFEKIDSFEPNHEFSTWIVRIAINKTIDLLRKNKTIPFISSLSSFKKDENSEEYSEFEVKDETVFSYEKTESLTNLKHIFEKANVSAGVRLVANMRIIEGYSYEDIAQKLNLPIGTVKSYVHRIREKLKNTNVKQLLEA